MPYVIRPPVRKMSVAGILAALTLCALLALSPSRADASDCDSASVSNPFASFLDFADYSLVPGGDFESGDAGWTLDDAAVAPGNESHQVGGSGDSHSLLIDDKGEAASPAFCVGSQHPTFRFFAQRVKGRGGSLKVSLRWNEDGHTRKVLVDTLAGKSYGSWQPSDILPLARWLDLDDDAGTKDAQLVFEAKGGRADWAIDDVFYDPYRR